MDISAQGAHGWDASARARPDPSSLATRRCARPYLMVRPAPPSASFPPAPRALRTLVLAQRRISGVARRPERHLSTIPSRGTKADPMTGVDQLRARFARRRPPLRRRPDRIPHPRGPRRARCPVPRPGLQPGHDPLGLPLPGAQRRPQLPRHRGADHRPPGGQRPGGLLAQHGRLLQRPESPPHGRPGTLARRTAAELQAAVAEDWKWNGRSVFIAGGSYLPCRTRRRTGRPTRSRWCSSRGSASPWPGCSRACARAFSLFPSVSRRDPARVGRLGQRIA